MQVKFPEQVQKRPALRAVFLILIKNYHAENHSGQKPLYTKQIRLSGYVISHQKQISENKCGMVIHNYIMTSQHHQ